MNESLEKTLRPFWDDNGRLRQWPSKRGKQLDALRALTLWLEPGRVYTEPELGDALERAHTFGDVCLLRRDLCDCGYLARDAAGRAYTLTPAGEQARDAAR
jgi:hypothetical protein